MSDTFYRKYRSHTFDQIVGQQHIIQTLKNAIENDRLSHAYIFSGPRGTGKTSMARILSKSVNCRNGKSSTPCLTCDICTHISSSQSIDVIEIDAASNTGVDNIRDLNDKVNFMPVECLYKVYIIDEVHMLSTGAFNALLKTLEEPPKNTIFILATTEPHKIPVTIHSRCQHLYFRNLTHEELTQHISFIAKKEGISIDDRSLDILARNAGGCMRDGVSLLDQMYSFKGDTIKVEDVLFILGTTEDKHLYDVLESVFNKDEKTVLEKLQNIFNDGANVMQLVSDLLTILRIILFVQLTLENELAIDDAQLTHAKKIAATITVQQTNTLLEAMAKTEMDLRWFSKPQLLLQSRLITVMHPQTEAVPTPAPLPQATATIKPVAPKPKPTPKPMPMPTPQPMAAMPPDMDGPAPTPAAPVPAPVINAQQQDVKLDKSSTVNWEKVINKLQDLKSPVHGVLRNSGVRGISDKHIHIKLKQDFKFFREKVSEDQHVQVINTLVKEIFGKALLFTIDPLNAAAVEAVPQNGAHPQTAGTAKPAAPQADEHAEQINEIVRLFEGTVI